MEAVRKDIFGNPSEPSAKAEEDKAKSAAISGYGTTKKKSDEFKDNTVAYTYTDKCNLIFDDKEAKTMSLVWDDGQSLRATKGATIDYVPKHMFIHIDRANNLYSPGDDFTAMTDKGIDARMALLIVLMRQVAIGLKGITVNASETVVVDAQNITIPTSIGLTAMLADNQPTVNSIVQQSISILALNGISLISRGHHYNDADQFWTRLEAATGLADHFAKLKITNWNGLIYHDALHVFDYDYVAKSVAKTTSGLESKVNGVVIKRLGTMPAGTTILSLIQAMIKTVAVYNAELAEVMSSLLTTIDNEINTIRDNPLEYCIHFQRVGVAERLARIARFEPIAVFLFAYLRTVEGRKTTLTSAKSIDNLAKRHADIYALGVSASEAFTPTSKSKDEVVAALLRMFADASSEIKLDVVRSKFVKLEA